MIDRVLQLNLWRVWAYVIAVFLLRFVLALYGDLGGNTPESWAMPVHQLLTYVLILAFVLAFALTVYHLWRVAFSRIGVIAIPMIWLLVFFLLPFAFVFVLSFSVTELSRPPYQPVLSWGDGILNVKAQMVNYARLVNNSLYIETYVSSVWTAFISTVFALIIGFPMAFLIARAPERRRNLLLMLVILPFWTSFLLRVYALIGLMQNTGQINSFLMWMGVIDDPIPMLRTNFAVYVGIVYSYLPFMILPLYANLVRLEDEVLEASADLGASPFFTFWQIIIPLSIPGIIAGSMLVFIPAVGEFVIPELLGGPSTKMIGKLLWVEFFSNRDWPMASALATIMLILVVLPFMYLQRRQAAYEEATA